MNSVSVTEELGVCFQMLHETVQVHVLNPFSETHSVNWTGFCVNKNPVNSNVREINSDAT